jgi:lysyl-tRNA synthetase class 2
MNDVNWALARKKQILAQRARITQEIRAFFVARGCLEIETPHRIPANAPEAHIDAAACGSWFLQTSPELAMKRLLAAGYDSLFQICRVWREGERGRNHLPEFTLLEWYHSGTDYHTLMTECRELLGELVPEGRISWQGHSIDIISPWEQLTVREAFDRYASTTLDEALSTDRFEEVLSSEIEPNLGQDTPTFLLEYPANLAALARLKPGDPRVAERFELYIAGIELANAFSELVDAAEQRARFEQGEKARRAAGKPPCPLPEPFLSELPAMPEAAGIALGVDRLVMLLTDSQDIADVVAFTPEIL